MWGKDRTFKELFKVVTQIHKDHMLSRLIIRNYALIENLNISFSERLNILTGETGAGKSIILGALSLLLGQRAEGKSFFNQEKKCVIEGRFSIANYGLDRFFEEKDLDYEAETVLRREITPDGKSRAFINDTPVNLATLRELGSALIDIHSQHATMEINDENFQTLMVDTLAANDILLQKYQENFRKYRNTVARIRRLEEENLQAKNDYDYYQFQFSELELASLQQGEQEQMELELEQLSHAEEIKRAFLGALSLIQDSESNALQSLKESLSYVQAAARYLPSVSPIASRLESVLIELKDLSAELETIEQRTNINEQRSADLNERLTLIYNLENKHRVGSVEDLLVIQQQLSDKLNSISTIDEELLTLKEEAVVLKAELITLSDTLSASRNAVIPDIEEKVKALLTEVGMPNAQLKIENVLLDEDMLNNFGRNKIQFLFSANKGQLPAPMNKVASGGELSRLMLSVKSLISQHIALPTIIFDEIDTGISGEVALKVGRIMERLSQGMQVISITHLPQIASRGENHYFVYKDEQGDKTQSNIVKLSEEERIQEIAKMLSGQNPGESALKNARELLDIGN